MPSISKNRSLTTSNSSSISSGRSGGGDRAGTHGQSTTEAPPLAVAFTTAPQVPRHHFTQSLSEFSSPLHLRRHSRSQSRSPASGRSQIPSKDQIKGQTQSQIQSLQKTDKGDTRGSNTQASAIARRTAADDTGAESSSSLAPFPLSQSPNFDHSYNSRTTSGMSSPLASAKIPAGSFLVSSGQHDGSSSWAGASSASLKSNRQPHIHADKDLYKPDEARLQKAQTRREDRQQHRDHDHSHRHHHHHHHHRQHHSWSTGSSAGHAGSHSTTIAALAATATAVAAASPITPVSSLPSSLLHQQTNKIGGSQGPEAVQSQNEQLQGQQHERQASMASGVGIPFDPVAVHAAAVALERIQREQSRNATRVLRAATTELDQLSSVTSQRLDAVYGSILTRLIVLQDTVLALRSLASAARATNRRFTSEAEAIAHEIGQQVMQLEAPDNASSDAATREEIGVVLTPADQQHRLELLSSRVHRGRQTIQDLAERVAMTHNKVQRWERADGVWQERTRARLKTLWVAISSALLALVLVVLLAVMLRSPGGNSGLDSTDSASAQTFGKSGHPTGNLDVASALPSSSKFQLKFSDRVDSANNGDDITATSQENDPLRRFLDEL